MFGLILSSTVGGEGAMFGLILSSTVGGGGAMFGLILSSTVDGGEATQYCISLKDCRYFKDIKNTNK
jgi:hypothetical protein